jgi:hypothetical protein
MLWNIRGLIIRYLLFAAILGAMSCGHALAQEMKRVTSPDQMVDAVLVKQSGNATAPDTLMIYLTAKGKAVDGEPIFVGDGFNGLDLGWDGVKNLVVVVASGRIFHFTNFWQSAAIENWAYTVGIHLRDSNYAVFTPQ